MLLAPMFVLSYFNLFIPSLGWGLIAELWILLATWGKGGPYSAGVELLANCRVVLGTRPPLAMNVANALLLSSSSG